MMAECNENLYCYKVMMMMKVVMLFYVKFP